MEFVIYEYNLRTVEQNSGFGDGKCAFPLWATRICFYILDFVFFQVCAAINIGVNPIAQVLISKTVTKDVLR
jgi:hypothetical protein